MEGPEVELTEDKIVETWQNSSSDNGGPGEHEAHVTREDLSHVPGTEGDEDGGEQVEVIHGPVSHQQTQTPYHPVASHPLQR